MTDDGGGPYIWRRAEARLGAPLPGRWGRTRECPHECIVEGLSASGCFVTAEVESVGDEPVFVKFPSPTGRWVTFPGRVAYFVARRGFAVEFDPGEEEARELIRQIVGFYEAGG